MPGRSTWHRPSSLLLGLPQDLRIEIAARVGATSEQPLADLRSLHGTCSTMRCMCSHGDVGRRLSIEGIRDKISWVWNPTAYKAFLALLSGLKNLEACFLFGIKAFFIKHRGYNDLRRAAEGGHDAATYLYAILLYKDNGGSRAAAVQRRDGCAMRGVCLCARRPHMRSTTRLGAFGVNCCRLRHRCAVISLAQAPTAAATWKKDGFKFLYFAVKTVGCAMKW
jgi:hypothetical protein